MLGHTVDWGAAQNLLWPVLTSQCWLNGRDLTLILSLPTSESYRIHIHFQAFGTLGQCWSLFHVLGRPVSHTRAWDAVTQKWPAGRAQDCQARVKFMGPKSVWEMTQLSESVQIQEPLPSCFHVEQVQWYILGDIHGNLRDLMTFEDQLWRMSPHCMSSNLVFAGDYVDRGEYGIECILYLFALKILNPNQVFLLRGNHEIRSIQRQFTFEKECNEK